MSFVAGVSRERKANVALTVTAVILMVATAARVQASTNQVQTGAPPVSPTSDNTSFEDYATGGWSGARQRLENRGISINAQWVLEGFYNARGGMKTGDAWASTFDLNLALDMDKAAGWKGGEFYVDLEDHAGRNPTADWTGDLQAFDKLNTPRYFQIYELWYQQALLNGWLRLKMGKMDANLEFSVIDNGLPFLNASTQVTPTILAFPTTPDPMPGVSVFFTPGKFWYASFGAYYANQSDTFGDITGHPQTVQPTHSGAFLIGETGLKWERTPLLDKDGNLKFGAWGHTGTFTRFNGSQQQGAQGYYAILDQTLWQPNDESEQGRGVRSFVEAGQTQASVSAIDWNVAGGATWTGPVAVRRNDILGFSANYAHLSPQAGLPHSYELALEWFYQVSFLKWATIQPDVQYIIHPGGMFPDAVVGTLDLTVQF